MAGTERQRAKFAAFDVECDRLAALWGAAVQDPESPVNVTAATRALNRYRHHRASIMAPPQSWETDVPRSGRFHVAWARTALRQAAKLLKTEARV